MSVHVPSLPSSLAWETPLNVSRDVLGAIGGAADAAAETAGHLIRPHRSASPLRSIASSKWAAIVLVAVLAVIVASVVRRSRVEEHAVEDPKVEGRSAPAASGTSN
jgi:hypothetical protein